MAYFKAVTITHTQAEALIKSIKPLGKKGKKIEKEMNLRLPCYE